MGIYSQITVCEEGVINSVRTFLTCENSRGVPVRPQWSLFTFHYACLNGNLILHRFCSDVLLITDVFESLQCGHVVRQQKPYLISIYQKKSLLLTLDNNFTSRKIQRQPDFERGCCIIPRVPLSSAHSPAPL